MKRILIALAAPFILGGCLLSPGKFASELRLLANDQFAFSYEGEIQMLALSKLAELATNDEQAFAAECFDDDFDTRECSDAEIAEQEAQWEAEAEERQARNAREAETMRAFLGDIDPSDPEAAQEIVDRLERQRGWNSVEYKGDGLFQVEYRIAGTLTHDLVFPSVEGMPGANVFVSAHLRDGKQVRVNAPGFTRQDDANPMFGGMPLGAVAAMAQAEDGGDMPKIAIPEGTFTIVTDGRILANNTDEGPASHDAGQILSWKIDATTKQAPTALIAFD